MRLIDADALKQHIDKLPALPDGNFAGNHSALKALINMQLPIDAVPVVHGWWSDIGGIIRWGCSVCHYAQETKSNYCPHCGARMDGEDGDGNE